MDNLSSGGVVPQLFGDLVRPPELKPVTSSPTAPDSELAADAGEAGTDEAVAFLQALDAAGRHNLVAIDPVSSAVTGRTFEPGNWPAMRAWIAEHNGRQNCYVSVNEPAARAPHDKLKKTDVAAIRCLCVDLDPPGSAPLDVERHDIARIADALQINAVPPTITIDSGGGSQAFWVLEEKLDPATYREWAEDQGRGLARMVGGDAVQNIDRIMRLPGTLNIPTEKKRAKGRVERVARVTHRTDRTYRPEELSAVVKPAGGSAADPATVDQAPLKGDVDLVRRALEALPNTIALFPHRADMIRVGMAVHAACADDPEAGRELFHGWASRWEGDDYDYEKVEKAWSSFRGPHAVGAQWIYDKARMHGGEAGQAVYTSACVAKWFDPSPVGQEDDSLFPAPAKSPVPARKRFNFEDFGSLATMALQSSAKPLIKGLLDQGAMSVLYGESNTGKTFVAMDIAYHVAAGRPWAGMRSAGTFVLYVASEGGQGAAKRIAALQHKFRDDPTPPFKVLRSNVNLLREDADLLPLIEDIRALGLDLGLIVIDTLSRAMAGGDENASTDMGAMVRHLDALRAATGAHLMVVHHSGKDRAKGARGHSLLRAATDTEIEITAGEIKVTKQRDLDRSFSSGFALEPVVLGVDEEGDPVTSCTVRRLPKAADAAADSVLSAEEIERRRGIARAVLRALDGAASAKITSILPRLATELNRDALSKASSRPTIISLLSRTLGDPGIEIEAGGQIVRIRAWKDGSSSKSSWIVAALKVPGFDEDKMSGSDEGDESDENEGALS